jgi:Flp pilus assembly protein TadD
MHYHDYKQQRYSLYPVQKEENFEMAITHFESALTLNSQDCGAFNNLGNCYDRRHFSGV